MPAATRPQKPRIVYPRPPLTALRHELFQEPEYEDGQAYTDPDDEDDESA